MSDLTLHEKIIDIQQRLSVPKDIDNKFGGFKYRNLEGIEKAIKPLLKEHQLILVFNDDLVALNNSVYVKATAVVSDKEGESVAASAFAREIHSTAGTKMSEPQLTGSSSSYARKYAVGGLFLIDDSTDDPDSQQNKETITHNEVELTPSENQDVLKRAKAAINQELERQDYTAAVSKKAFITKVLGHSTIDDLNEADLVMDALENEAK